VATQFKNRAASFKCNRRPNGYLVATDALLGGQADNANCPSLP
jgi:hypothetical protein